MIVFYNLFIFLYGIAARVLALFQSKAKLFVDGRKHIFQLLAHDLTKDKRKKVWFHVASLGEFEQALPLMAAFKKEWPQYALVLSFYSPSGYEIRKNHPIAEFIYYLPLDTAQHAQKWIQLIQPQAAFFAKYDLWYHYLNTLKENKIPCFLFSAVFQERQVFFKWYGSLHRKMLRCFDFIFVQDEHSLKLLQGLGLQHAKKVGDTRIDRVIKIKEEEKELPNIVAFKGDKKLFVMGSAWKDDWELVLEAYPNFQDHYKLLIAPHDIDKEQIKKIVQAAQPFTSSTYTQWDKTANIMILDTMGMLSKVYRYADVVWIGGGFQRSGIHNILEPAVYGMPIFFGSNYKKFVEANFLIQAGGAASIDSFEALLNPLYKPSLLGDMRTKTQAFIAQQAGATQQIIDYLKSEKNWWSKP